ncbi:GrxC Glutaredoxin and related proteins [uncultured Caudovirales phage]|uniref:GrxC Glutaredoxin and related proteins n=1 Tax=uncultured Caudovirales phage TaxID=2100421 RepID=A0A6J7WXF5_9CAUD|nr:GrxC Glutaredoxin and related proteins [uncultured Caudovirales phage]CAB5219753.1 GrxC Glutaredoxin and related proteins [uncultured Caudovirales phage]
MSVIVYSNPNCVQCEQTKKYLTQKGVEFESKMIQDSPEILPLIEEKGYKSAPVVVAGDQSWSGFRLDHLYPLSLTHGKK